MCKKDVKQNEAIVLSGKVRSPFSVCALCSGHLEGVCAVASTADSRVLWLAFGRQPILGRTALDEVRCRSLLSLTRTTAPELAQGLLRHHQDREGRQQRHPQRGEPVYTDCHTNGNSPSLRAQETCALCNKGVGAKEAQIVVSGRAHHQVHVDGGCGDGAC